MTRNRLDRRRRGADHYAEQTRMTRIRLDRCAEAQTTPRSNRA